MRLQEGWDLGSTEGCVVWKTPPRREQIESGGFAGEVKEGNQPPLPIQCECLRPYIYKGDTRNKIAKTVAWRRKEKPLFFSMYSVL